MGNHWGKGKREWGAKGGGEVSIQPTWDLSGHCPLRSLSTGQESHHDAKEGFQVSKTGVQGRGQGFPNKGGYQKDWVMYSDIMLLLYISC